MKTLNRKGSLNIFSVAVLVLVACLLYMAFAGGYITDGLKNIPGPASDPVYKYGCSIPVQSNLLSHRMTMGTVFCEQRGKVVSFFGCNQLGIFTDIFTDTGDIRVYDQGELIARKGISQTVLTSQTYDLNICTRSRNVIFKMYDKNGDLYQSQAVSLR